MAQKKYSSFFNCASQVSPLAIGSVVSGSAARARIADIIVGPSTAAPADQAVQVACKRFTTAPSGGSSITPLPLDPNEEASRCTGRSADTTDATYVASSTMLQFGLNMRATFRWVAAPDYEMVTTVGTSNGIAVQKVAESAGSQVNYGSVFWFE